MITFYFLLFLVGLLGGAFGSRRLIMGRVVAALSARRDLPQLEAAETKDFNDRLMAKVADLVSERDALREAVKETKGTTISDLRSDVASSMDEHLRVDLAGALRHLNEARADCNGKQLALNALHLRAFSSDARIMELEALLSASARRADRACAESDRMRMQDGAALGEMQRQFHQEREAHFKTSEQLSRATTGVVLADENRRGPMFQEIREGLGAAPRDATFRLALYRIVDILEAQAHRFDKQKVRRSAKSAAVKRLAKHGLNATGLSAGGLRSLRTRQRPGDSDCR